MTSKFENILPSTIHRIVLFWGSRSCLLFSSFNKSIVNSLVISAYLGFEYS